MLTRAPGVWLRVRRLAPFLDDFGPIDFRPPGAPAGRDVAAMAGWGLKGRSRLEAEQRGLPYIALEDGFFRSVAVEGNRWRRLSLIADPVGMHYDASRPSSLEMLIENWTELTEDELAEADMLMELMRDGGLGKFNAAPDAALEAAKGSQERPRVLVVDQIAGDLSLEGGGADVATFEAMAEAAREENPDAEIVARIHPLAGVGERQSALEAAAIARGLTIERSASSFMSEARRAEKVYVATSGAGLEALIAGAKVICFGQAFFAGWGLTEDRAQPVARRTARPPLRALVAAAYLKYCRYVHPHTGKRCGALDVAEHLVRLRRLARETAGHTTFVGVEPWKWAGHRRFFEGGGARARLVTGWRAALDRQERVGGRVAFWVSKAPHWFEAECARRGVPTQRVEDGFVRSVGLGSNLVRGHSLVADGRGVYYDPRRASDLEHMCETESLARREVEAAKKLRERLVDLGVTKYNVGALYAPPPGAVQGRRRILVPAQVVNDASVRTGSPDIRDNLALLQAVRAAAPDAYVMFKPHPDVEAGNRPGVVPRDEALCYADEIVEGVSIDSVYPHADEVHTMTSLSGFEALMRGLKVTTYGGPFYAGWGLTEDRLDFPRRRRRLSIDELVAFALMRYPRYVHPATGAPCGALDLVEALATQDPAAQYSDKFYLKRAYRFVIGLMP